MQREHVTDEDLMLADAQPGQPDALTPLLRARPAVLTQQPLPEVVIGELIAITDDGCTPLILYPGQAGDAALRARSILDLHGAHIGKSVVLSFENGDPQRPIVIGLLRAETAWPLPDPPGQVELSVDGERMVVGAREQLVLRCGSASITLTRAGKVLIQGDQIVSRASGAHRIKGGSVQIN